MGKEQVQLQVTLISLATNLLESTLQSPKYSYRQLVLDLPCRTLQELKQQAEQEDHATP